MARGRTTRTSARMRRRPSTTSLRTTARGSMAAVVFTVDAETVTGRASSPNEEIAAGAAANDDVLIPFASVDPHRPNAAERGASGSSRDHGVRGFKFHPNIQAFFPNDRAFYPVYEAIEAAGCRRSSTPGTPASARACPAAAASASSTRTRCTSTTSPSTSPTCRSSSRTRRCRGRTRRSRSPCTSSRSTSTSPAGRRSTSRRSSSATRTRSCATASSSAPTIPLITPDRWLADFEQARLQGRGAAAHPQGERDPAAAAALTLRTGTGASRSGP